jgi:hypothetical protein
MLMPMLIGSTANAERLAAAANAATNAKRCMVVSSMFLSGGTDYSAGPDVLQA